MNPRRVLLEKISDVQRELMSQEFGADYNTIVPVVSKAIEKITAKGIPVTKNSLKNHIPWNEISTEQRIKCTEYLNEMEASK